MTVKTKGKFIDIREPEESQLSRQVARALAKRDKLVERQENALKDAILNQNKNRLADIPLKDMSWKEAEMVSNLIKADREDDHYYDNHPGEKRYNDTRAVSDISKPHQNDPYYRYQEALQHLKQTYQEVINNPRIRSIPGAYEKLGKIAEMMNRIESAIDEGFTEKSITKSFKGYTRPCAHYFR